MISQQLAQTFIILKPSNISAFYQEIEFFGHHFMFTSGAISYWYCKSPYSDTVLSQYFERYWFFMLTEINELYSLSVVLASSYQVEHSLLVCSILNNKILACYKSVFFTISQNTQVSCYSVFHTKAVKL